MVDFAKIRADNAAKAAEAKNKPIPPSEIDRVSHMITYHLTEITDWEEGFIYSIKTWLAKAPMNFLSDKQALTLKNMEDKYCGSMCHALNKAGVKHG